MTTIGVVPVLILLALIVLLVWGTYKWLTP